jgi:hypothetical protein
MYCSIVAGSRNAFHTLTLGALIVAETLATNAWSMNHPLLLDPSRA